MLLLPRNLKALADLTAKENPRYAVTGVRVEEEGRDAYRVQATDGRIALVVTGKAEHFELFPRVAALGSAPNSATETVIPAADWRKIFRTVPGPKVTREKPALANVAVVMGDKVATMATFDTQQVYVKRSDPVEGRWPCTRELEPKTAPKECVKVDPSQLRQLLQAIEALADDERRAVTLELRGPEKPVVLRYTNTQGQAATGYLMPLSPKA